MKDFEESAPLLSEQECLRIEVKSLIVPAIPGMSILPFVYDLCRKSRISNYIPKNGQRQQDVLRDILLLVYFGISHLWHTFERFAYGCVPFTLLHFDFGNFDIRIRFIEFELHLSRDPGSDIFSSWIEAEKIVEILMIEFSMNQLLDRHEIDQHSFTI